MSEIVVRRAGYGAALSVIAVGLFLLWYWRPERQVRLHSAHLLRQIEKRNWRAVEKFVAPDYRDQWGNDRAHFIARSREVLRYFFTLRLIAGNPLVEVAEKDGLWSATLKMEGSGAEGISMVMDRVNGLSRPFELRWRRTSGKPWDWKLVSAANEDLDLPASEIENGAFDTFRGAHRLWLTACKEAP